MRSAACCVTCPGQGLSAQMSLITMACLHAGGAQAPAAAAHEGGRGGPAREGGGGGLGGADPAAARLLPRPVRQPGTALHRPQLLTFSFSFWSSDHAPLDPGLFWHVLAQVAGCTASCSSVNHHILYGNQVWLTAAHRPGVSAWGMQLCASLAGSGSTLQGSSAPVLQSVKCKGVPSF